MAAAKKKQTKQVTARDAAKTKRGKRAAKRTIRKTSGKSIVQRRRFKAAKPTEETPLPEPIATFTF
jgi:hypothetical protein